jgi:hypothetical protein
MAPLVKKPKSVKNIQLLKMDLHHIVEGSTGKSLGAVENEADLWLVPVANDTDTATLHGEPVTLTCAPYVRQLVFDGRP